MPGRGDGRPPVYEKGRKSAILEVLDQLPKVEVSSGDVKGLALRVLMRAEEHAKKHDRPPSHVEAKILGVLASVVMNEDTIDGDKELLDILQARGEADGARGGDEPANPFDEVEDHLPFYDSIDAEPEEDDAPILDE